MAILNYTTKISSEKTSMEIQRLLSRAGASAVLSEYDDDRVLVAMSFRIRTPHGLVSFRLPANTDGVLRALKADGKVPKRLQHRDQAARVAWRIVKDWIEAQLAIVEAELAAMTEVFLPYAQGQDGRTVYETLEEGGFKALTHQTGERA